MNQLDELPIDMFVRKDKGSFDILEMVDLSLASTICPDNATMFEVSADAEYVTVCIHNPTSERKITIRNTWQVAGVFYYYPAEILKNASNCKVYLDLLSGNIFCSYSPLKYDGFDVSKL